MASDDKVDKADYSLNNWRNEKGVIEERDLRGRNMLLAAFGTLLIAHLVSVSLLYGGTSDISVLSAATQEWLLSTTGTAIVFVAPVVLAAIVGLIAWTATKPPPLPSDTS